MAPSESENTNSGFPNRLPQVPFVGCIEAQEKRHDVTLSNGAGCSLLDLLDRDALTW
jgi:hypothetical protein